MNQWLKPFNRFKAQLQWTSIVMELCQLPRNRKHRN